MTPREAAHRFGGRICDYRRLPNDAVARREVRFGPHVRFLGPAVFLAGDFAGGEFHGGIFRGGVFRGGVFRGGTFYGGRYYRGEYLDGLFLGGTFFGGSYHGGIFRGGIFCDGRYYGGLFVDGLFRKGLWYGGRFLRGTYDGGAYYEGTYAGGSRGTPTQVIGALPWPVNRAGKDLVAVADVVRPPEDWLATHDRSALLRSAVELVSTA